MNFKKNILLKNYTTFRIGGPAEFFFEAKTQEDLIGAVKWAMAEALLHLSPRSALPRPVKENKLPFFILGGGSNLLVSDRGYKGLVINLQFSNFSPEKDKIIVGAGARLSRLVNFGLEWAAGIPGTVGGAIYGNAGAFGKSMEDEVKSVTALKIPSSKSQSLNKFQIKKFSNKECCFGYRDSVFKHTNSATCGLKSRGMRIRPHESPGLIILSAEIKKGKSNLNKIKEYLEYRRQRHPQMPSAGSIFKNVKFTSPDFQKLLKEFPDLETFRETRKVPAAILIDRAGLTGKKIGRAQISNKHSNFIVNLGNARAEDVKKLIKFAKEKVKKRFGIEIKEEIELL